METTQLEPADWLEDCLESVNTRVKGAVGSPTRADIRRDDHKENRIASKPHSTPLTLKWLEENYEIAEGVCIPRSALYAHYLDFCNKNDSQPVNAASFGKIIRQQFPQITTRRLGTRGQSKYHYYGVGIRDSSSYYDVMYSKKGVQSSSEGKKENIKQIIAYSPRSKLGTLLPEFPNVKDIKLPPEISEDKVQTFLMMYRTHCQRILDTVIRANFDEVQSFLLHFWQGMPQHIVPILESGVIVNLVGVCDSILYKAISGVLMPTVLQSLPDSLTQVIRKFAKQLDDWLRLALEDLPEPVRQMKFDLARRFGQLLRRQTSLNHLCQASRTVIHSADITAQMLDDWSHVDLSSISKQTLYTMDHYSESEYQTIVELYKEFEMLLEEQAPIESYTEWLDSMVARCVVQPSAKKEGTLRRVARQFLLMWSCFGTRVIRDMTLHSAPSFGSFHLLHLMFDDYVLFLVENLHSAERSSELLRTIKGEKVTVDPADELVLPNPTSLGAAAFSPPPSAGSQMQTSPLASTSQGTLGTDRQTVITDARDAYSNMNNNTSYAASPQSVTSRDPTSPINSHTSYDTRIDDVTSMSPGGSRIVSNDVTSDNQYPYGRYYVGQQGVTASVNNDPSSSYSYGYHGTQYPYGGRESSMTRDNSGGCDWTESQRYGNQLTPSAAGSNFSAYGPADPSTYNCDPATYTNHGSRNHSQHGVIYQHYSSGNSGYYGNPSEHDAMGRKRKSDIDDVRGSGHQKRNTIAYDYTSYAMTGSYARA